MLAPYEKRAALAWDDHLMGRLRCPQPRHLTKTICFLAIGFVWLWLVASLHAAQLKAASG